MLFKLILLKQKKHCVVWNSSEDAKLSWFNLAAGNRIRQQVTYPSSFPASGWGGEKENS